MRVQVDPDETWALLSLFVKRLTDEVPMSDEDRAKIRLWRSEKMKPSSTTTRELTEKVNVDLDRMAKSKERSQIRRADWQ